MTVTANDLYALGLAVGSLLRGHVDPARQDRVLDLIRTLERQAGAGEAHTAIIIQAGSAGWVQAAPAEGYLVQCPYGCNLGTTAHAPDREAAERRVDLHRISTTPAMP